MSVPYVPYAPRVLFVVHHALDPNAGVSGATMQLAAAMRARGATTEFFTFDDAFDTPAGSSTARVRQMLAFPWHVAKFLSANASRFDVVDASTGDLWRWLSVRPSGSRTDAPLTVTRAHGLEHWAHKVRVERARRGELTLSWKYRVYHGGWRLREVARTLRASDGAVFLNQRNHDWAHRNLQRDARRTTVIPNALPATLLGLPVPRPRPIGAPLGIAVLGAWTINKGRQVILDAARLLEARAISVQWHLLGTHIGRETLAPLFPTSAAERLVVHPRYDRDALPTLLAEQQLFVSASWSEGFNMSLVETMACGLTPVVSNVGAADTLVTPELGTLLPEYTTGAQMADAVAHMAQSAHLNVMRAAAQQSVQSLTWDRVASDTLDFYASLHAG